MDISHAPSQQLIVGEYAKGKGGFFVGTISDGNTLRNVFAAPMDIGYTEGKWSDHYSELKGVDHKRDGRINTAAILAAEPDNKIAKFCTSLEIEGHTDFYWPSEFEQNLVCINLPNQSRPARHWSSTQYSAYGAWIQDFEYGDQGLYYKDSKLAARAVRSELVI